MILVQITGQPATGKTTGARHLNPDTTYYIDADGKGLAWKGWKNQYNPDKKNYTKTATPSGIYKIVKGVAETRKDINCIVIDTVNSMMTTEEMAILEDPSRDKWADLAVETWNIFKLIREIPREDMVVFVMAHCEPYDVNGITHWRTMTNGKKLSKINLNAFLAYNLYARVNRTPDGKASYELVTQTDGTTEARSVMDVFPTIIENNLEEVRQQVLKAETE